MFPRKLLAIASGVFALALVATQPAVARNAPNAEHQGADSLSGQDSNADDRAARSERPGRTQANRQRARSRQPVATPEEIKAAAQAVAVAAGISCQVTEATNPGVDADDQKIYEAACSEGPGYILLAATPPQTFNCLELAGTAVTTRRRDPAADVGQQCVMPVNQNGLAVIGGWARAAGVACTIDEAVAIGKSNAGNLVYEIGCAGADGYWLEQVDTGWQIKDCLQMASSGGECFFTTAQEQADGFEPKLADTDAAACDVAQVALMGSNANGRFYEAKCVADGEGYIVRLDTEGVTQQVYPCATAQHIGGGCKLTPAPTEE
ncbi:MAG: hypothetical protein ACOH1E_08205 [Brevundimonas sp.]